MALLCSIHAESVDFLLDENEMRAVSVIAVRYIEEDGDRIPLTQTNVIDVTGRCGQPGMPCGLVRFTLPRRIPAGTYFGLQVRLTLPNISSPSPAATFPSPFLIRAS